MNEINLEKTKQELKDRVIILSEQGLFVDVPRMFSILPEENDYFLGVKSRLPVTFPILSFDTRREIECNLEKTLTGYSVGVCAWYDPAPVKPKSRKETGLGYWMEIAFWYLVGSDVGLVFSFWVNEAIIPKESRRLTTCGIRWTDTDPCVPATTNYVITTINDAKTLIFHTNVVRKAVTEGGQLYTYIDVQNHKLYEQPQHTPASSIAAAIAEGRISEERYRTYKGMRLFGVGTSFPLDKTNSFHLIFMERRRCMK